MPHRYRSVSPDGLIRSTERLQRRVDERFPGRGISRVCSELLEVTHAAKTRAAEIVQPFWWLRVLVLVLIFAVIEGLILGVRNVQIEINIFSLSEFLEAADAGFNILILGGAAIFFLVTLEIRLKRTRALKALHELRSLAHVIEMPQLTKDPERILHNWMSTPSSPKESLNAFELTRYLDYCSEMLSIIGKISVLYVQGFEDEGALAAVYEIENLTSGLSRKIWQKIMIIRGLENDMLNDPLAAAASEENDAPSGPHLVGDMDDDEDTTVV
jgi:hypothetical protein